MSARTVVPARHLLRLAVHREPHQTPHQPPRCRASAARSDVVRGAVDAERAFAAVTSRIDARRRAAHERARRDDGARASPPSRRRPPSPRRCSALSRMMLPIPTRQRSPTTQPWRMAPWPTVTSAPRMGVRDAVRHVDAGEVLDVGARADADRADVAAEDGAEPDAGAVGDLDVADDGRVGREEDVAPMRGAAGEGADQRHHDPHAQARDHRGARGVLPGIACAIWSGARARADAAASVRRPERVLVRRRTIATSTIAPRRSRSSAPRDVDDLVALGAARPERAASPACRAPRPRPAASLPTRPARCARAAPRSRAKSRARRARPSPPRARRRRACARRRVGPRRVLEPEEADEADLAHQGEGRREVVLGLAREADDDVRREGDPGDRAPGARRRARRTRRACSAGSSA